MKNRLFFLLLFPCFFSCKNKKNTDSTKAFFSVVDFLESQIKQLDSLPRNFTKFTAVDSNQADTSHLTKEEFDAYAKEFTSLPDIALPNQMNNYSETNNYDETLGNILLIYTPKKDNAVIQNETIMMQPDEQGNTQVQTILVKTIHSNKDSSVEKNLTWHINSHFQIVTKTDKPGQPEKVSTTIIKWE